MSSGIVETTQSNSDDEGDRRKKISRTRLVQRLLAATSALPNFVEELIVTQATVVAGTEAAAFVLEPPTDGSKEGFSLKAVAHIRPDNSDAETRAAALQAFQEIVRPCIEQGKEGAIHIDGSSDGSESQYCLVTLLRSEGNVVAASAVITRARDTQRAQKLLEPMLLVAGYFDLFTLRRRDEQSRSIAQSHQHVLQLATAVATADGFEAGAMNLCNELAARSGAARVALGWVKGDNIKLKAISHTEQFDKKQDLSVTLVRVMEECWDNDEIVQYEPDGTTTATVTREAASLSRSQGGETILSLPLRRKGEVVGVVTLEFAPNQKLGAQVATGLAVAIELLAPQLYDRYQNDRYLVTKTGLAIQDLGKKTIGPKYMLAKTVVALVIVALLFVTLYRPMYRVVAPFQFAPIDKQAFSAPYDGELKDVYFEPGQKVKKGDVLAEFDATELKLQRTQYLSEANKAEKEAQKYKADPSRTADMLMAIEDRNAAMAKADYAEAQIERAKLVAPFDGEILTATDLKQKRHATFKQGDPLFEMAQEGNLKAELSVNERDIQDIKEGDTGKLATSALPYDKKPFTVERIVPLGTPKENANVFTVMVKLDEASDQWRPGMQGEARIDVGNRSLLWIYTHKFVEFVRLKLWI